MLITHRMPMKWREFQRRQRKEWSSQPRTCPWESPRRGHPTTKYYCYFFSSHTTSSVSYLHHHQTFTFHHHQQNRCRHHLKNIKAFIVTLIERKKKGLELFFFYREANYLCAACQTDDEVEAKEDSYEDLTMTPQPWKLVGHGCDDGLWPSKLCQDRGHVINISCQRLHNNIVTVHEWK